MHSTFRSIFNFLVLLAIPTVISDDLEFIESFCRIHPIDTQSFDQLQCIQYVCTFPRIKCYHNHITDLSISYLRTEGPPLIIKPMKKLKTLSIVDSCAQVDLDTLDQFVELRHLTLRSLNLSGTVPTLINENLLTLDLSSNFFKQLPNKLPNKLRFINLGNNSLKMDIARIAHVFNLPDLQYLFLNSNAIYGNIPPSFTTHKSLKKLTLARNQLDGPIPSFRLAPNLTHLDLSYNRFSVYLPLELLQSMTIRHLDLRYNKIFGSFSFDLILHIPSIEYLDISNNNLIGSLPRVINSNNLHHLYLQNNRLTINCSEPTFNFVHLSPRTCTFNSPSVPSQITLSDLSGNEVSTADCSHFQCRVSR